MYITISSQYKTSSPSVKSLVDYLEKENEGKHPDLQEHFFNHTDDKIIPEKVIADIDGNTAKLNKKDARFYSIVVSPSARELKHINNDPAFLRHYTREIMKDYAASFHRDKVITVNDIKYYAKIEHERTFKSFHKELQKNAPYSKKIARLENNIAKINRGELKGNVKRLEQKIERLKEKAPYKLDGKMIREGMKKEGVQTHVHIIVSRKDMNNHHKLSPMESHKASIGKLNEKESKKGFNRDGFFKAAEKRFDKVFKYDRNFAEKYKNRKLLIRNSKLFFSKLSGLPTTKKATAFKILHKSGIHINIPSIPTNKVQLALKAFEKLKKGVKLARDAGSIGV